MKRALLPPLAVLAVILAFSLWTGSTIAADSQRWQQQLEQASALARQENWAAAAETLSSSYRDWSSRQEKLHILLRHDVIDDAEAMYRRAMAFAATREPNEFRAEIADLRSQLRLLAELEEFSLKNVL